MQTADQLAATQPGRVFAGQNFEALTSLLCGELFRSTADGGTWFFPDQKWQQRTEGVLSGGKRGLWACYSAALVLSAGDVFYSSAVCRESEEPRVLTAILCVYGSNGERLWGDYCDAKAGSILLNEECYP